MTEPTVPRLDLSFLRDRSSWIRIAVVTAAAGAIGLGYGRLSPKWYRSTVTVVPAAPQRQSLGAVLGPAAGSLGAFAAGLDAGATDTARIAAVLQGTAVTDAVVARFDLKARYGAPSPESAREALWSHCAVSIQPKPNLLQLTCEDRDPRFVQELLGYFAEYGNQVFRRVGASSASEEVRFLERQVTTLREQADEAAARLRRFQEEHQIVDLETQAKAVVSSMATLNSERIARQMELSFSNLYASEDEASARRLRSQVHVLDEQLRDLEAPLPAAPDRTTSSRAKRMAPGLFPPALAVPKLRSELEALIRDRKVAEATLMFALERLVSARATEARELSTFLVLDPPPLPTRKSRPSGLAGLQVGAVVGLLSAMLLELARANREVLRAALRKAG